MGNLCVRFPAPATAAVILAGLLTGVAVRAGEVQFATKPSAAKEGDKVKISFSASAPTDAAVYVLDARGKCVRHLAAGVLGAKTPPPGPLKTGLAQSLEWDGKDDAGKPAAGGPFSVRVKLGIKPVFDRMIGDNPMDSVQIEDIRSMGIGRDGTLYVHATSFGFGGGSSHGRILALDRSGKYLRTVAPYAANMPEEILKGIRRVEVAPGVKVPFIYNAETRAIIPGLGGEPNMHRSVVTPDGRLILSGSMGIRRTKTYCQLVSVGTDGSIPAEGLLGTEFGQSTSPSLALSPDGKILYATGVDQGVWSQPKLTQAVYAFDWKDKEPKKLIGEGLDNPRSVAVGADGTLYVADKGHDRVAVFTPGGKPLGELKTVKPERVEVHPKTGVLYVLGGEKVNELRKFSSWKAAAPAAEATLPFFKHSAYTAMLVLDASAEPPVLWVAPNSGHYARFYLLRMEDRGASFSEYVDVGKLGEKAGPCAAKPTDLALFNGKLYIWAQRGWDQPRVFDARTGVAVPKPAYSKRPPKTGGGFLFDAGRDGNGYLFCNGSQEASLARFNSALEPFPYPSVEGGMVTDLGGCRTRLRGMCADLRGTAYVLRQKANSRSRKGTDEAYADAAAVTVVGPDGRRVNDTLVDTDIRSVNSVRTDPAGNLYLAVGARVGGKMLPPHLDGQVPNSPKDPGAEGGYNYYPLMYGTIVKFGPEGGEIRVKGDGLPATFGYEWPAFIKGAKWTFFGASIVPVWVHGGFWPDICACESPRFDVDGFGRVFFGDACGFRVGVLDTAGNLVTWFGGYGNQDSAGPGSAIPTPEIPVGWVHAVAVDDEAAYIGDRLNARVVRVKLGAAAEETCEVR